MKSTWPIVAEWVWYYEKGTGDPIAALVTAANRGILDLTVWRKNARVSSIHSGVRHKDDPWNKERPARALDNGTWAYKGDRERLAPEVFAPPRPPDPPKPAKQPGSAEQPKSEKQPEPEKQPASGKAGSRSFKHGREAVGAK